MSPLPGQASFSTATTAVASQGVAYPSVEEFTSFKLPATPKIVEPNCDSVSEESDNEGKLEPRPATPTPPSPVSTESSDLQINDDTPTNVRGESMIFPRQPLSVPRSSNATLGTPRWPFQNATPRPSVMVPMTRSVTASTTQWLDVRRSHPPEVSMTESLDEFQINHPHARMLALHPANLSLHLPHTPHQIRHLPQLVETPFRPAGPAPDAPQPRKNRSGNFFDWSRRLLKSGLRSGHGQRNSAIKPKTWWYQRISTQKDMFYGCTLFALFFLINFTVSTTIFATIQHFTKRTPFWLAIWEIISLCLFAFTSVIWILMFRFRKSVHVDEESRGRSIMPRACNETHIPASPREIEHRRTLGAASQREQRIQSMQQSDKVDSAPHAVQITEIPEEATVAQAVDHPDNYVVTEENIMATIPRNNTNEQIENYWTDVSLLPTSQSQVSSTTAVIDTAPAVPANTPRSER
ncbi:hypothetical protein K4K56_011220 [Colletotrichum sp. SAR 10_98]|nr:hypothetical protein K4K56_011220 [Colletotrichum sp. SAR 10_98]